MEPEQAAAFLAALTRSDGWTTPVTFQTFDDRAAKDGRLARILHGSLRQHLNTLRRLNERGAGVFVTVNETDGRGRREENIVALRACFIDCDGPRQQPFALKPSLAVKTPHGGHAYFCLRPAQELDRFRVIQQQLAAFYGSDPSVCDLPRVMRLPGMFHRKGRPVLIELVSCYPERRYTLDDLAQMHPASAPILPVTARAQTNDAGSEAAYRAWAALAPTIRGRRNCTAFKLAVHGFALGIADDLVRTEVETFCCRAGIANEAKTVFRSALRAYRRNGNS